MILVDTSIWIDHLRSAEADLTGLLTAARVLTHPMVIGELALGRLADRDRVLALLGHLPPAVLATHDEVLAMVGRDRLFGTGLGLVDAHLLASARLTPGARLWTRDRRLAGVCAEFAAGPPDLT